MLPFQHRWLPVGHGRRLDTRATKLEDVDIMHVRVCVRPPAGDVAVGNDVRCWEGEGPIEPVHAGLRWWALGPDAATAVMLIRTLLPRVDMWDAGRMFGGEKECTLLTANMVGAGLLQTPNCGS